MTKITSFCILRNGEIISAGGREKIIASTVDEFLNKIYDKIHLSYPKFYKMDNQSRLGFLASEILLPNNTPKGYLPGGLAVILSNSNASLDTDLKFEASLKNVASPSLFVYTLSNIVIGEICIRHSITGENAFFITPSFDGQLLFQYVEQVLLQEHVDACLAGWVDVVGEQYDVFLYLVEKENKGLAITHNSEQLKKLYNQ
jgi:hypothetical protein